MKALIVGSLLLSSASFAQSIDLSGMKKLMKAKKDVLETATVGMSKKIVTKAKIIIDDKKYCDYTQTSNQSIIKIEDKKMIVLSKETFEPADSEICKEEGYESYVENILYFEDKPSIEADLADLDASASNIKSLTQDGNVITMGLLVDKETLTFKYDLSKPSFRNLVLSQGTKFKTVVSDMADINISQVDLTDVLFCGDSESDSEDCVQGDFSDILY